MIFYCTFSTPSGNLACSINAPDGNLSLAIIEHADLIFSMPGSECLNKSYAIKDRQGLFHSENAKTEADVADWILEHRGLDIRPRIGLRGLNGPSKLIENLVKKHNELMAATGLAPNVEPETPKVGS